MSNFEPTVANNIPAEPESPKSPPVATRSDGSEIEDLTKLIVNYLPDEVTETVLYNLFVNYGEIESVRVMRDRCGQPKGYGFVKFAKENSAAEAIRNLVGVMIGHKRIKVDYCRPGGPRNLANLFVGSLPEEYKEEDLVELFQDFAPIIDARILRDHQNKSKRCGFVRLDSDIKNAEAIESLNGKLLGGQHIQVRRAKSRRGRRPGSQSPMASYSYSPSGSASPIYMSPTNQPYHAQPQLIIQPNGQVQQVQVQPQYVQQVQPQYVQYQPPNQMMQVQTLPNGQQVQVPMIMPIHGQVPQQHINSPGTLQSTHMQQQPHHSLTPPAQFTPPSLPDYLGNLPQSPNQAYESPNALLAEQMERMRMPQEANFLPGQNQDPSSHKYYERDQ